MLERWITGPIAIACLSALTAQGQSPPFSVRNTSDGLPSNTVYGMLQDRDGYLWFGTDAGLARYDGTSFRSWTTSDGLSDNEVLSLCEDPCGRIWCLTLNGRLCYIHEGRAHAGAEHPEFLRIRPVSGFMGMAVDDQGYHWFGGIAGELYSWRNGEVRTHEVSDRSHEPAIHGMVLPLRVGDGSVRVVVNGSLYVCKDGEPVFLRTWDVQPTGIPMVTASGDSLVALGSHGPFTLHDTADAGIDLSSWALPFSYRPLFILNDGTICHSSGAYGVLMHHPRNSNRPSRLILEHFMVNSVLEDREQNLWCSTDGQGLVMITRADRDLLLLQTALEQRQRTVKALLRHRSGDLIFGTAGGAILRRSRGTVDTLLLPPVPMASSDRVRDLQEAADGSIWFTTDKRTGRISMGGKPKVTFIGSVDDRLANEEVPREWGQKSLATGADGTVVASAFGLALLENGENGPVFAYRKRYRAGRDRIYAPHVMPDGTIWYETNDRLNRLRKGDTTSAAITVEGLVQRITDIDALADGTLVIATAGSGTMLLRDGSVIARFDMRNGAPSDQCRAAVVRDGAVLVATAAGAYIVQDPLGSAEIQVFSRPAASSVRDVTDIDGDDQHLYLATPEGLCIVPLPLHDPPLVRPILHIDQVVVNDSALGQTDTVHMMLGERLSITLIGLAYAAPEQVHIQWAHSTEGPWQPTGPVTQFNGLAAGEHRFLFRAALPHGPWSATRSMTVLVSPPWYRTTWASMIGLLLAVLLVIAAVGLLFRSRIQRHKEALLRQLATQEERQRIASELHDDLGADISHLLMLARQTTLSPSIAPDHREQLSGLESHARSLMHKVDEIIWSLDPQDDELRNALVFIQRYAEQFAEAHALAFRTQPLTNGAPIPCTSKERRDLFLVVKELLQNIIKHNAVSHLLVVLSIDENTLRIVIEDDGAPKAERTANGRNGHGKANINLRIERLKGAIGTVRLEPLGTRTSIVIPLPLNNP